MKTTYKPLGSISHGTMREEDLIPCFASELETLAKQAKCYKDYRKLINEANAIDFDDDSNSEDWGELVTELMDALNELALPGFYFGAHEGDGSDYGFWLSPVFIEDFDGLKVSDLSEVPNDYYGEILHINDHGNMSLYYRGRGPLKEIWSLV